MAFFKACSITINLICLLAPTSASAETWTRVNTKFSVDTDSILAKEKFRRYWQKFHDEEGGFMLLDVITNCNAGKSTIMQEISYYPSHEFAGENTYEPGEKVDIVVPGTLGEMVHEFVCQ